MANIINSKCYKTYFIIILNKIIQHTIVEIWVIFSNYLFLKFLENIHIKILFLDNIKMFFNQYLYF